MRVGVDLKACQDHGQCVFAAPEVFAMDASGQLALRSQANGDFYQAELDDSLRMSVEDAVDICPLQAISIQD